MMNDKSPETAKEEKGGLVECAVCLREIPADQAKSVETHDYVSHFCGLDCYEKWRRQQEEKK